VVAAGLLVLASERGATAQLRGDAAVSVGAVKRFASAAPDGASALGVGPIVGINGHVALLPLVRVGAYASAELGPDGEAAARRIYAAGLRVKLMPPWPRDDVRAWVFAGLGYAGVYAPSYTLAAVTSGGGQGSPARAEVQAPGAGGRFFEIPIGVGAEWRFRKPWALSAELTGRIGLGFSGTLYDGNGRPGFEQGSSFPVSLTTPGHDAFALGLTLGIGFDR
jgi:hypothetical protein